MNFLGQDQQRNDGKLSSNQSQFLIIIDPLSLQKLGQPLFQGLTQTQIANTHFYGHSAAQTMAIKQAFMAIDRRIPLNSSECYLTMIRIEHSP